MHVLRLTLGFLHTVNCPFSVAHTLHPLPQACIMSSWTYTRFCLFPPSGWIKNQGSKEKGLCAAGQGKITEPIVLQCIENAWVHFKSVGFLAYIRLLPNIHFYPAPCISLHMFSWLGLLEACRKARSVSYTVSSIPLICAISQGGLWSRTDKMAVLALVEHGIPTRMDLEILLVMAAKKSVTCQVCFIYIYFMFLKQYNRGENWMYLCYSKYTPHGMSKSICPNWEWQMNMRIWWRQQFVKMFIFCILLVM